MYETPNKVLDSARELSLDSGSLRQVDSTKWPNVLSQVFERFATTSNTKATWLWAELRSSGVSVSTSDNLALLSQIFAPETRMWLLVEDWDGTKHVGNYWVFEASYGGALAVLGNMHFMEFYIVDQHFQWILMENHHNVVVAVGEPAETLVKELAPATV